RFATLGLESRHDPADAEAAIQMLQRSVTHPLADKGFQASLHGLLGILRWLRVIASQGWTPHKSLTEWNLQFSPTDLLTNPDFSRAVEHFRALRALDPTTPPAAIVVLAETLYAFRDGLESMTDDRLGELIEALKSVDRAEAGLAYPTLAAFRGNLLVELAGRTRRAQDVDRAVADLRAQVGDLMPGDPIRNLVQDALGRALNLLDEPEPPAAAGQDPIADLQRVVAADGSYIPTAGTAARLVELADAHHQRGETGRAIEVGRRALAEFAQAVLVSDDPEVAMETARAGNQHVGRLAHWCLERGEPTAAVDVLEAGRGLILHATTLSIGLPELLRRSGHADLAAAWVAGTAEPRVRSDAVAALYRSPAGMRLLTPPSPDELGKVVWAAEIDSLVYLMAGQDGPGAALLVRESGVVEHLPLPELRLEDDGPVAACRAAHRAAFLDRSMADLGSDLASDPAIGHWHESLSRVSEWAHDVAIGPLLTHVSGWGRDRLPRLSLVPTGPLAAVAWHAARHGVAGELRYACQDAVLSYAASARQLADATGRRRLPLAAAPVFVANPSGGQIWASMSAVGARSAFYPEAGYLGYPTTVPGRLPGTPEQVLAHLPSAERDGASMLQLSSHAKVQDSSTRSYFELAQGHRLAVSEILAHSHGRRPDAPGGLVICDSCMTDLSEQDHDEVLTLGTAFLAAGAVSVIGARWPIDDRTAAVMTFVLHHQLALGLPPAEALHRTQLWMLDPSRPIPPQMPLLLAAEAKRPELAELAAWAALTHQGQ
ncbi:MAG TPA: CHAT domain-containing protein, partial [Kineosporiaceae bacterium]|nr:CHAT domain-containing protein [Kineosporiaceae bacterium]